MLTLEVTGHEFYDHENAVFVYPKPLTVRLEHSLISIAKWEAIWKKPYLPGPRHPGMKGYPEELSYVGCMVIGNVPDYIPGLLLSDHGAAISAYIDDPQTATTIHRVGPKHPNTKTVTSELVYYWMIKFGIPFECDKWHFNRLLTLIDVCNVKESSSKDKMSTVDSARYRHNLNKARRG